jgi:hypothetical protein
MRKLFPLMAVAVFTAGISLSSIAKAFDDKPVTIEGDGICAKCALKETPSCQNVVVVKEGGKEIKYYLAPNPVAKKYHGASGICSATTDAPVKTKVVGTVEEKDGKKVITATSVTKKED